MVDRINVLVGAELRRRRAAIGMSQAVLAERLGLSRASITNVETGRQPLSVANLYQAAAALGVRPADLLPDPPPAAARPGRSARNVSRLLELLSSADAAA